MAPPLASEVIKAGTESAGEIQRVLRDFCHLSDGEPASLICVDLQAQPPHHTRSELRTSLMNVGQAAVECLEGYPNQAVSLIVLTANCRVSITPRPEGYLVSVGSPELISGPANPSPSRSSLTAPET